MLSFIYSGLCLVLFICVLGGKSTSRWLLKIHQNPPRLTHDLMQTNSKCLYHLCFDVYKCNFNVKNVISVYTYPLSVFVDSSERVISPEISKEYVQIINAIRGSKYHTSDIAKACVIVPPIDTLNQDTLEHADPSSILNYLPSWKRDGTNHLLFNMLAGNSPDYHPRLQLPLGKAMLAGAGFSSLSYRAGFDVSLPVFNAFTHMEFVPKRSMTSDKWFLISSQVNYRADYHRQLKNISLHSSNMLFLEACEETGLTSEEKIRKRCKQHPLNGAISSYDYPKVLKSGTFCIVLRGIRLAQTTLMDSLMMGCIPVVFADTYIMPFSEVIDWQRASVILPEDSLGDVVDILKIISPMEIADMRKQIYYIWNNYFSSINKITLTTIKIINDRVYPYSAWKYQDWNAPLLTNINEQFHPFDKPERSSLVFVPLQPAFKLGFTAIVFTQGNRIDLVFSIIKLLGQVKSLTMILILWNNQEKDPPQASDWPSINKPIKVLQMKYNRLSNRFFPFKEIRTDAILQLDDDILNLSLDDVEFGYQAWCEFPDHLVGFPGRIHYNDNSTGGVKYSIDRDNDITMVLTSTAFHHKMYSHMYTYMMNPSIRRWVDEHMNCEDVAMNFLINSYSGKTPIKVTPRKGFSCNRSAEDGSLCGNPEHQKMRSKCVKEFIQVFGKDVLKKLQFRADPLLMKENLPKNVVKFRNVGEL